MSKAPAKKTSKAKASMKKSSQDDLAIFLPTLLPDPFGETSPELCWEWRGAKSVVALRLTQFGWNATASGPDFDSMHINADTLPELRGELLSASLSHELLAAISAPWILAYEAAGLPN